MKTTRFEKLLLGVAGVCLATAGWLWWSDRPSLRFAERTTLTGLVVHQPQEFAVELHNDSDQPRKVIGARVY